jgi:RNA polymerase sigma factor (sigma-70 family)
MMASELEKKVREMDDESKSISARAREISKQEDLKYNTVYIYLRSKRAGYTHFSYIKKNLADKGRATNFYGIKYALERGFLNPKEYSDARRLIKNGNFKNLDEAREYLILRKSKEKWIYEIDPSILDNENSNGDFSLEGICDDWNGKEKISTLLEEIIGKLNDKYNKVIRKRFFDGLTLEQIRADVGFSKQHIQRIEKDALKKLYFMAKVAGLEDLYVGYGID